MSEGLKEDSSFYSPVFEFFIGMTKESFGVLLAVQRGGFDTADALLTAQS